jgi:ATP-dependent DNA ligase
MEQTGNKYRTHSGLQDGQIVVSEYTTVESKNAGKSNATTEIFQATREIDAKYKKQLKTGYHEDVSNIDTLSYVEPMLAQPLHKLSKQPDFKKDKWGMQCKFNGNRCVATKDGLFTRTGEKYYSVSHIENSLASFFEKHPTAVLDGELFNNDLRQQLNEISKLIRKTVHIEEIDLIKSEKLVRFYLYDGYNFDNENDKFLDEIASYAERKMWIDVNVVSCYPYLCKVDTIIVQSKDHMMEIFQSLLINKKS